jgi:hypothetical protein
VMVVAVIVVVVAVMVVVVLDADGVVSTHSNTDRKKLAELVGMFLTT